MKKLTAMVCIIATIPFILCSCSIQLPFFKKEVEKVELNHDEMTVVVGDSFVLEAEIEPKDAENRRFDWSTSDSDIITVDDGKVKAKKAGEAVVTVETDNGEKDYCDVTVIEKEVESISLNTTDVSVKVGKKIQITAKTQPADAPQGNLKWTSADESIALVNSEGYVTGVKTGITKITCTTENDIEAVCVVTVKGDEGYTISQNATVATEATSPDKSYSSARQNSEYFIFPYSSIEKITEAQAASLKGDEVDRAINEIYARNGYVFKEAKWRNLFGSMSWYTPNPNYDGSLNSVESYNVNLLSKYR